MPSGHHRIPALLLAAMLWLAPALAVCLPWGSAAQAQVLDLTRPKTAAPEGSTLVLNDARLWDYGEYLFTQGEYYRAISEYRRLLHFFPQSPHAPTALLRVGEAHLHGGEAAQAVAHFAGLADQVKAGGAPAGVRLEGWQASVGFLYGLSLLELDTHLPFPRREANVRGALLVLAQLPPAWPGSPTVRAFTEKLMAPTELPSKSPWLAGGLSAIVPGTGSMYVGRYREGALSLFVNALLIAGTVRAHQQEQHGMTLVLGVTALTFYGGNIYAAVNGAHKYNADAKAAHLRGEQETFGIVPRPGGWSGFLRSTF